MNIDQKAINIINVLARDYINLISINGIGMYVYLVKCESNIINNFEISKLALALNLEEEQIVNILKKLNISKLIEYNRKGENKYFFKTLDIKTLVHTEKLHILDNLFDEKLITDKEKKDIEYNLLAKYKYEEKTIEGTEQIKNFIRPKKEKKSVINLDIKKSKFNPDSFPALVYYYYELLSKYFGGYYKPHSRIGEAKILRDNMRANNDTPDSVRKMFEHFISDAKIRGNIESVCHIGSYIKMRPAIYYRVFINNIDNKVQFATTGKPSENINLDYIKEMFDYFKQKNFENDIIKEMLISQFGQEPVKEFFTNKDIKNG